jgi:hypothetical protein
MNLGSDVVLCRVQLIDSRVHACLYFVAPNGHGLRQLDIEVNSSYPIVCTDFMKPLLGNVSWSF